MRFGGEAERVFQLHSHSPRRGGLAGGKSLDNTMGRRSSPAMPHTTPLAGAQSVVVRVHSPSKDEMGDLHTVGDAVQGTLEYFKARLRNGSVAGQL